MHGNINPDLVSCGFQLLIKTTVDFMGKMIPHCRHGMSSLILLRFLMFAFPELSTIALFTVTFSHLHYNVFERGCEAISGNFVVSARNCLTSMFKNIVMQMRKGNCEKGY